MTRTIRLALAALIPLLAPLAGAPPAAAVEYRLQVVSIFEDALKSFLRPGETGDGAAGPGLDRLEASLDTGAFPAAVVLYDRPLEAARELVARGWGAAPVRAEARRGGEGKQRWDAVIFEGTPGERSLWLVAATTGRPQEVARVALRGAGPLRLFQPYARPNGGTLPVLSHQLSFLWTGQERGDLWDRHVGPALDLAAGIGVVVGVNQGAFYADHAYIVVQHGPEAATYKAILAWKQREQDREAPSFNTRRLRWR